MQHIAQLARQFEFRNRAKTVSLNESERRRELAEEKIGLGSNVPQRALNLDVAVVEEASRILIDHADLAQ